MPENQLLDLKNKIEKSENKVNQLMGEKNALMRTLKDDFQCLSTEEAEKLMTQHEQVLADIEKEMSVLTQEITDLLA